MDSKKSFYDLITEYRMSLFGFASIWIFLRHIYFFNLKSLGFFDYFTQLGDCGVDIFLFLSGFGCYYSYKKEQQIKKFYAKRAIRILPTIAILLPIFSIIQCVCRDTSFLQIINPKYYLMSVYSAFWYVGAIIMYYLAVPFIFKYLQKKGIVTNTIIFTATVIICLTCIGLIHYADKELLSPMMLYFARFPVFVLGAIFAMNNNLFEKKWLIFAFFVVSLPLLYVLPKDFQRMMYIFCTLASVVFLPYVFDKMPKFINAFFKIIGIASLEFYIIHVFVFAQGFEKCILEHLPYGGLIISLILLILISILFQKMISLIQDRIKIILLTKKKR